MLAVVTCGCGPDGATHVQLRKEVAGKWSVRSVRLASGWEEKGRRAEGRDGEVAGEGEQGRFVERR
jgi:hypothetical protein